MKWIVRGYLFVLLAYTGWRTFDFMLNQLPAGDTSAWLAIFFLFSTEVGLLIWHEINISHTTTYTQHYLSMGLMWLDFVGSLGAGIADMIIRQTLVDSYQIPPVMATGLLFGLPILVAFNVAGGLVYLMNDSNAVIQRETRFLNFEAQDQAIRELQTGRSKLVSNQRREIFMAITGNDIQPPIQVASSKNKLLATISGNGKGKAPDKVILNSELPLIEAKEPGENPTPPRRTG